MRRGLFFLAFAFLAFSPVGISAEVSAPSGVAVDGQIADPANPETWLGLRPEEAYRLLGAPAEISAVNDGAGHLDVIHYYPNFTYLFWFDNHVWQVRLDRRYTASFLGLRMGMTLEETQSILSKSLGTPVGTGKDWTVWPLTYQNFPRRLKLYFEDNKLVDAFYYRGDL